MYKVAFALLIAFGVLQAGMSSASAEWAIAIGQAGHDGKYSYGTGYNAGSEDAAESRALNECSGRGIPCKIVAHGTGLCVALAFGKTNDGYGWVSRNTAREALNDVLPKCRSFAGVACEVRTSFCDN